MADWGLYSALQGKDNWQQRRQDKAMNLQIIEAQNAKQEQKVKDSIKAEQEINAYFDQMTSMDVLEEDQARIQELEKRARQNIIKGIAQNNGDLSRYVSSGGMTDLAEYRRSILQSQEVKDAIYNKASFASYLNDRQKGNRYFYKVDVQIPMLDENGEQLKDENGNARFTNKKVNVNDALRLFKENKINRFNYNGSEEEIKINPFTFKQHYKDPRNPYSKDNIVTASNVKFVTMQQGASEEQATEIARNYVEMWKKGGESWKWKADSELDYQNDMATLQKKTQTKSSSGVSGKIIQNQVFPMLSSLKVGDKTGVPHKAFEYFKDDLGFIYDEKTNTSRSKLPLVGFDAQSSPQKGSGVRLSYDLTKALSVTPINEFTAITTPDGRTSRFMVANAVFPADDSSENTPGAEGLFGSNKLKEDAGKQWAYSGNAKDFGLIGEEYDDVDAHSGLVLIPVESIIGNPLKRDEFNKLAGIKDDQQAVTTGADNADIFNDVFSIVQKYAAENNISPQQAYQELNSIMR